eukprot:g16780.t1
MALEAIGLTPAAGELLGQATPNLKALPSFARPATPWASRWTPKPLHAARVLAALVLAPSTVRAQRVRGWKHRSASKRARTVRKSATWEKVEWASLGSSPAPAGDSASRTSSNGEVLELGALANRLRLASVLRAPGFWDLCSMLGSLQSFRLQLQVRTMREEVRKMTEEWAQQNPQAFKDLKRNPQVLPSKIRASGERVKELLQEGTQELQSTFQEILQTPSLSDGAVRLEEAVEQELQRNLG